MGEFDIHYKSRNSIKGQAAADFISEMTPLSESTALSVEASTSAIAEPVHQSWNLYVDGSTTKKHSGADIIISLADELTYEYALRFNFPTSNNVT